MEIYHITLNNLRRRKAKMIFVLLSLIIGIATIVSVNGIVEAMKTEMTRQVMEFGVNVVITPDSGGLTFSYGGITLPEIMYDVEQLTNEDLAAIEDLSSRNMIKVVAPKLMALGTHGSGHRAVVVGANLQQEFLVKPWLRIRDIREISDEINPDQEALGKSDGNKMDYQAIDLSRQDVGLINLSDNQIILGYALAQSWKVKEGDTLAISGHQMEVYGILAESGSAEDKYILMNLLAAQERLDRPNEITVIEMAVDYLAGSEETLIYEIQTTLSHTRVTSLRQETLRGDGMLMRLTRYGMAISVLILLVGMLVVGLTMSNSVRERTREIGVFRALGFRKSHIAKMILLEGAIISLAGGLLGFFGGTLIARYGGRFFSGMDIQVPWRFELFIIAVTLSVIIGLISSLYPAYQAAKQDPAEALRFI